MRARRAAARPLVLGTILAVGALQPLAGQEYVAVGDSITAGVNIIADGGTCGGSNSPPATVADDGVPGGLQGSQCGYPQELEERLACSSCVDNEGIGGERTDQILSRINALLDAADWDVMLYMAGTNDIWQSVNSGATIKANIKEATRRAAARGIDSVVASVMRFGVGCVSGGCNDSAITTLRNNVSDIASENSLYFADPYNVLCPGTDQHGHSQGYCFDEAQDTGTDTDTVNTTNSNHYLDDSPDPVGHPDADGVQMLADEFEDVIEQSSLPNTPSPQTPSGPICDSSPTFTWDKEGNGNATWYELEVEDAGNSDEHREWYPESSVSGSGTTVSGVCSGSSCSVDPGLSLSDGDYTWHVRGRSPRGFSSFASDVDFEVVSSPPSTPTAQGPAPDEEITSSDPTYEWLDVGADSYALSIDGGSYETVSPTCSSGTCSDDASGILSFGPHTYQVRATNCAGNSFSAEVPFTRGCGANVTHLDQVTPVTSNLGTINDCEIRIADDDDGMYIIGNGGVVTALGDLRVVIANGLEVLNGGQFTARNSAP